MQLFGGALNIPESVIAACSRSFRFDQGREERFPASGNDAYGVVYFRSILNSRRGFTLLELMISIAMIGVIVLILFGAMRLGFRSVDAGEKKIETLERLRASLNTVDAQIQSEVPISYTDEDGSTRYYFKGEETAMEFSTNYSLWSGQAGYVVVHYTVASDSFGQKSLLISENVIGMEAMRQTYLFDSFSDISFEYFYKSPTDEVGNWVTKWTDDTDIPEKVKLHLVRGAEDFSMIIPMRARGNLSQQQPSSVAAPPPQE